MKPKRYTIEELAALTGFSRRTIRYYIQEGLLEPPAGRGRGGFYFDSHLERLRRIRSLQDQGLRLAAIREILADGAAPAAVSTPPAPPRQVWIRVPVVPGLEIHVDRELEQRKRKEVAELVRVARSLLEGESS